MFRRLPEAERPGPGRAALSFRFEGREIAAFEGDSVATALLAAGIVACRRTPVSGEPRAPYCLMGVCFDCLVTIDGVGNRQGCLVAATAGMQVARQDGPRDAGAPS